MDNTRVLIVDDEEIVRDSIREILLPRKKNHEALNEAAMDLFDEISPVIEEKTTGLHPNFSFDEANNGKAGLMKVKSALEAEKPYAVIFLDMRMPGWDGLKTCVEIRKIDPKAQIFFITAYTDRSIDEIIQLAGGDVGYLSKPFVHEEIIQLATKGVYDWYRLTNLERLLEIIGQIGIGNSHLRTLLINILHQISDYVGTEYAVLGKLDEHNQFEEISKVGMGDDRIQVDKLFSRINLREMTKIELVEGVLVCPIEQYCVLAIPSSGGMINQEKSYLLHLFIENAVRAIRNAELSEQLVQKEKLSAIGQAISMVMHDIKTPISQIYTLAQLIKDEPEDQEMTLEMTGHILDATRHATDIIYDVRDFVRNAKLKKEPIEVSPYLADIIQELKHKEETKKVHIAMEASENLVGSADPRKLKRVIVNLINNAVEAMDAHGVVDPAVSVKGIQVNGHVELSIQDNGPGIPENIRRKLFDPFVTSGKENGTGLGLAIVKQIVEAHDGKIKVDSSDAGACFTICLPRS
ncbi:MAG: hybrid sensor histidine kinase/response regulator [Bacteroidota bacterium]